MSFYPETKIYKDGNHYVGIPHTERPKIRKRKIIEEEVEVLPTDLPDGISDGDEIDVLTGEIFPLEQVNEDDKITKIEAVLKAKTGIKSTRKELFNSFYRETFEMTKREQKEFLFYKMRPYFQEDRETIYFVEDNLQRMKRNYDTRKNRLERKVALQNFNYFATFTYDDKLHSEESFKKKLKTTLKHFCARKGWKYIAVWERSPEKKRLHLHALLYVPEGTMSGELIEVNDFSFATQKRQITHQNTFFKKKFGRTDFEPIGSYQDLDSSMNYLLKYIEKSGEKIMISKGIPTYFYSDISEDDVLCRMGIDDKKLLLRDDFTCWHEGEYIGPVSPETIEQLPKGN